MRPEHQQLVHRIRASAEAIEHAVDAFPVAIPRPKPGEHTPYHDLLHTRDAAMLSFGLRIRHLLFETDPVFTSYDEKVYRELNASVADSVDDIIVMIVEEHDLIARLLSALPDDAWERSGRNTDGSTSTVAFLAQRIAEHAEEHATHIAAYAQAANEAIQWVAARQLTE